MSAVLGIYPAIPWGRIAFKCHCCDYQWSVTLNAEEIPIAEKIFHHSRIEFDGC